MAKNIEVNLQFRADTQSVKQKMQDLQDQLSTLAVSASKGLGQDFSQKAVQELNSVTDAALKTKVALQNSMMDNGKLNIGKFDQQLKKAGLSIKEIGKEFSKMGPQGAEAFGQLAARIRESEAPLISLQGKLKKLGDTFANTIRWQITSSITTLMYQAFSSTIEYAEKLNKSLNDIRIVTGKNVDTMSKFAKEAQKASKELSSSTLDYTKASLIYYQQGLGDKEVKERTDTTVKLANVVGENAETVSEWMTSIWNNFDDGSKSMEYYADVLAKLGAATASSADEIAGGLEKFAAVADTVGLSYEYAASAVTTMTAATRQSEDVVGTSLKTVFARMEDLDLGKTLEDGVNLGSYSGEMAKVGIEVLDVNGNLKDMDTIVDSIMSKWDTLSRSQQVALAQTIGGVRQYSQVMSLFDNSDAFKQNVEWAKESTGELEQQNLIYQQGIEGAQARLKNSLEYIKNSILDENDLVPILNGIEKITTFVGDMINALGGLPGILTILVNKGLQLYGPQAAERLRSMVDSIKLIGSAFSGKTNRRKNQMITEATQTEADMYSELPDGSTSVRSAIAKQEVGLMENYNAAMSKSNGIMKQVYEMKIKTYEIQKQEVFSEEARLAVLKDEVETYTAMQEVAGVSGATDAATAGRLAGRLTDEEMNTAQNEATAYLEKHGAYIGGEKYYNNKIDSKYGKDVLTEGQKSVDDATTLMNNLPVDKMKEDIPQLSSAYNKLKTSVEELNIEQSKPATERNTKELTRLRNAVKDAQKGFNGAITTVKNTTKTLDQLKKTYSGNEKEIDTIYKKNLQLAISQGKVDAKGEALKKTIEDCNKEFKKGAKSPQDWAATIVNVAQVTAQAAQGFQMITSGVDSMIRAFDDGNFSLSQLLAGLTSLAMGIVSLSGPFSMLLGWLDKKKEKTVENIAVDELQKKQDEKQVEQTGENIIAEEAEQVVDETGTAVKGAKVAVKKAENKADKEKIANTGGVVASNETEAASDKAGALVKLAKLIAGKPILGFAVAAVVAGLIGVAIGTSISKKNKEEREEQANENNENFQETADKANDNKDLVKEYRQLKYQYDQTGEGKDKLAEQAKKLAEAYGIEGDALAELSGDYDEFTKTIEKKRVEELKKVQDSAQLAIDSNQEFVLDAATEGFDNWSNAAIWSNNHLGRGSTSIGGDNGYSGIYSMEFGNDWDKFKNNSKIKEVLNQEKFSNLNTANKEHDLRWNTSDELGFTMSEDSETIARNYKEMQQLYTALSEADENFKASDTAQEMRAWLTQNKEQLEKTLNQIEERDKAVLEKFLIENSPENIDSMSDLSALYDKAKSEMGEAFNEKDFSDLISQYTNAATYETYRQAAQSQMEKLKEAGKEVSFDEKDLRDLYGSSTEIFAKALSNVDVTKVSSIDELIKAAEEKMDDAAEEVAKSVAQKYSKTNADEEAYAKILKDNNSLLKGNDTLLHNVTGSAIQLNGELETLSKTWDSYNEALLTGKVNSSEYAYAVNNMSKGLKSLLGITNENVNLNAFVRSNKELLSDFFDNGNIEAFNEISTKVSVEMARQLGLSQDLNTVLTTIGSRDYKAGEALEQTFIDHLNNMLASGKATVQQLEQIFGSQYINLDVKVNKDGTQTITGAHKTADSSMINNSLFKDKQENRKKRLKEIEAEGERYHEINEKLEDTNRLIGVYSKAADRAFGNSKVTLLNKQIQETKKEMGQLNQKLAEAEGYLKSDREKLLSFGVSLDGNGVISNYDEVVNSFKSRLRAAAGNDEKYSAINEEFSEFKNALDKYEDSLNTIESLQEQLLDKAYEISDMEMNVITVQIDFDISKAEEKIKHLQWQLDHLERTEYKDAEKIANLSSQTGYVVSEITRTQAGINEIMNKMRTDSEAMTEENMAKLDEYMGQLRDYMDTLEENQIAVIEALSNVYDKWIDKIDKAKSHLESLSSVTDSFKNIVDLVGKGNFGFSDEILENMLSTQMKVANNQAKIATEQREMAKRNLEEIKSKEAEMTNEVGQKAYQEALAKAQEAYDEANTNWYESLENALQKAADAYQARIEQISKTFEKSVSGIAGTLSEESSQFDIISEINSQFLDEFEKSYEISKLNRQINQSISKMSNQSSTTGLKKLQQEILDMGKEGNKVSKKQIEYKQKEYEILVAQAALQEAQDNKSIVRLRRDSEGNYGYVYTADQDKISELQQTYEDKIQALHVFWEEWQAEEEKNVIDKKQWLAERLQEIANMTDLSVEEREALIQKTLEQYTTLTQGSLDRLNWLKEQGTAANAQYDLDVATDFRDTVTGKIHPDYDTWDGYADSLFKNVTDYSDKCTAAIREHADDQSKAFAASGTSLEEFKDDSEIYFGEIRDEADLTAGSVADMRSDFEIELGAASAAVSAFQQQFGKYMDSIRGSIESTYGTISTFKEECGKLSNAASEALKKYLAMTAAKSASAARAAASRASKYDKVDYTIPKADGSETRNINTRNIVDGETVGTVSGNRIKKAEHTAQSKSDEFLKGDYGGRKKLDYGSHTYIKAKSSDYWYDVKDLGKVTRSIMGAGSQTWYYIKKGQQAYIKYDTGGYTGAWGKEGRLAMLHQKELVLNADDTKNFLSAVSILRDINSQINLNVAAMRYSGNLSSSHLVPSSTPTEIKQEVTISAEFPNATNHSEIEEAFRNLNNMAIQYIHKS